MTAYPNGLTAAFSFSEAEREQIMSRFWTLLRAQAAKWNGMDSTSLPVEPIFERADTGALIASRIISRLSSIVTAICQHLIKTFLLIFINFYTAFRKGCIFFMGEETTPAFAQSVAAFESKSLSAYPKCCRSAFKTPFSAVSGAF